MDWRILLASFALVFLAELGDKTQLTALAFTTSSRSPWAVFFGTSLALVAASAMAVAFGELLSRFLPVKVLHISSGVLFILMGLLLLVNIARRADFDEIQQEMEEGKTDTFHNAIATGQSQNPIFRLITNQATLFEENLIAYLQELNDKLPPGQEKEILRKIIAADHMHSKTIARLQKQNDKTEPADRAEPIAEADFDRIRNQTDEPRAPVFNDYKINHKQPTNINNPEVRKIVEAAIEAEENIAEFYLALARISKLYNARKAFRTLAMEDLDHAHKLCSLINPDSPA